MTPGTPTLVVLAAGMSSRYNADAAAGDTPRLKQIEAMGPGGALLDYSVFDAIRAGFGRVVFVIRRDFEDGFRRNVIARFGGAVAAECVWQESDDRPTASLDAGCAAGPRQKPWGTGHATWAARHAVHEPFGVINADDFYGLESFEKLAAFLSQPDLAGLACRNCLVGFPLRETLSPHGTVARGVCAVSPDGLLDKVEERTGLSIAPDGTIINTAADGTVQRIEGNPVASLNMWGFSPRIFGGFERALVRFLERHGSDPKAEFYIPAALDELIREGAEQCRVLRSTAKWFGVTYRADVPRVRESLERLHAAGEYPEFLWGR
jgi:hypothetical protein